jgi:hypothetical protein
VIDPQNNDKTQKVFYRGLYAVAGYSDVATGLAYNTKEEVNGFIRDTKERANKAELITILKFTETGE